MNSDTLGWTPQLPPRPKTEAGEIRRIGVEIELSGLTVAEVAHLLGEALSAAVEWSPVVRGPRGSNQGPIFVHELLSPETSARRAGHAGRRL